MRQQQVSAVTGSFLLLLTRGQALAAEPVSAAAQPEVEVKVQGERRTATAPRLTAAETRQLPGAFGDPFRAVEALPGVTPIASGAPFFFVRGSPPSNIGYFLDGVRVPYLYHLGLGPSVVHPTLVKSVELHSGGYPARFGRFTGGIVAAETAAPRHELRGEVSARLVDAGMAIEAPFANQRGTVMASGRYGYPGLLLPLFAPEISLEYWDYQTRASYDVTDDDRVSVLAFGAHDLLAERQGDGSEDVAFNTEFHRVDLRYDRRLSDDSHLRLAVLTGYDRTQATDNLFISDRLVGVRADITTRVSENVSLRFGTDANLDAYGRNITGPLDNDENHISFGASDYRLDVLFKGRSDVALGAFVEAAITPTKGVTIMPGVRADYYASDGNSATGIDPRIAARFDVSPKVRLVHSLGLVHQPPSFVGPIPGLTIAGLPGGLQRSVQASSGVEVDLPAEITATLTAFDHVFFRMTDVVGASRWKSIEENDQRRWNTYDERSLGSTIGMELFVKRPFTRRLTGFVTYTLSRSTRSMEAEHFPARFDRTHVFNLAAAYDLGRRWRAGCRLVAYSGNPAEVVNSDMRRGSDPERLPGFHRIDVRLEKRWPIAKRGYWSLVFEVLNSTLRKEVISNECNVAGRCEREVIGPVTIPSIGVEAVF